jgi:hypothetical protein
MALRRNIVSARAYRQPVELVTARLKPRSGPMPARLGQQYLSAN